MSATCDVEGAIGSSGGDLGGEPGGSKLGSVLGGSKETANAVAIHQV